MADTVLTELKIHEFDTVAQFLQHESEVGENDLALTPFMPANLYLFYHHWADHIVNDPSWLRADTFSWQSGDVYQSAYQHLVEDFDTATSDGGISFLVCNNYEYYRDVANDHDGQIYPYAWTTKDVSAIDTTLYSDTENPNAGDYVSTSFKQGGVEVQIESVGSGVQIDTIGDITITYHQSEDGHKICTPDQESDLIALYEKTGVAWYYILDTVNKQFKLPRSKHNKYADTVSVVGNGVSIGFTDGTIDGITLSDRGAGANSAHLASLNMGQGGEPIGTARNNEFYAQAKLLGVTTDPQKSGIIAQLEQDTDQYKYLYFYVGHFEQDSVEQTAGINAEMFNAKADRNLMNTTDNVDIVIESQLPTEENGYTWYRKYKSGWVEQGGYDSATFNTRTWNYPVEMQDEGYTLALSIGYGSISSQNGKFGITARTTTGFSYQVVSLSGSATGKNMSWYVCGMAA